MTTIPFKEELLAARPVKITVPGRENYEFPHAIQHSIASDSSQLESALNAMQTRISVIQGPPGTGKTYIGVQLVRALVADSTPEDPVRILCLCYTNHALDSFLEALIDNAGISINDVVRLGSSPKMREQFKSRGLKSLDVTHTRAQKSIFAQCKAHQNQLTESINAHANELTQSYWGANDWQSVKEFLWEYSDDDDARDVVRQLTVPVDQLENSNGMKKVGKKGKEMSEDDAWRRWFEGKDKPSYITLTMEPDVWAWNKHQRHTAVEKWRAECMHATGNELKGYMKQLDDITKRLATLSNDSRMESIRKAVIIGCTTTTAAKYHDLLENARPSVVLVEEAAEILESHVLTNISSSTKQVIMIGDHKQLRPKLEHYMLRKESNQKIDFDVSLFERLVLNHYPVSSLSVQHRMRPEISCYVRHMTYPNLVDAPTVQTRDNITGVQCNVAFIDHRAPEASADDRLTMESCSKTNQHEIDMCVAIVKYFLQQGYDYDDIVVLTPYLGQLVKIQKALKDGDINCAVGDLDKRDVAQFASVLGNVDLTDCSSVDSDNPTSSTTGTAVGPKATTIRVATIDNYQGEEAKIILASMVRSNPEGDIGFLSGAERINVLFSRARDGFFVLGNAQTLRNCRNTNGRAMWNKLLDKMVDSNVVFTGFPARCNRHKIDRCLTSIEDFRKYARNGGCDQPCNTVIPSCSYGHLCSKPCHGGDHSQARCKKTVEDKCARGLHCINRECGDNSVPLCRQKVHSSKCTEGHILPTHECRFPPAADCKSCVMIKQAAEEADEKARQEEEEASDRLAKEEVMNEQKRAKLRRDMKKLSEERHLASKRLENESLDKEQKLVDQQRKQLSNRSSTAPHSSTTTVSNLTNSVSNLTIDEAASAHYNTKLSSVAPPKPNNRNSRDLGSSNNTPVDPSPVSNASTKVSLIPAPINNSFPSVTPTISPAPVTSTNSNNATTISPTPSTMPTAKVKRIIKAAYANDWNNVVKIVNSGGMQVDLDNDNVYDLPPLVMALLIMANVELNETSSSITERLITLPHAADPLESVTIAYVQAMVHKKLKQPVRAVHFARFVLENCNSVKDFPKEWSENVNELIELFSTLVDSAFAPEKRENGSMLSESQTRWKNIVDAESKSPSPSLDIIMKMIGLESIKKELIAQYNRVTIANKAGFEKASNYNTRFDGNPGTGKTTVARLYANFLIEVEILPEEAIVKETTGSELKNGGVRHLEKLLEELQSKGGGVLFVDEAYQLDDTQGHTVLDFILANATELKGKYGSVVWIFAGYAKLLDKLFEHNPGLPSRFPNKFVFEDYKDEELLEIFNGLLKSGGKDVNKSAVAAAKPKAATSVTPNVSPIASNVGRYPQRIQPRYNSSAYGDQVDEWGNTWKWEAANYRFIDPYGNISGYGVNGPPGSYGYSQYYDVNTNTYVSSSGGLGTVTNPVVDNKNAKWQYDRASKSWFNDSNPVVRQTHYPGSPKPVIPEKPAKPFVVEDPKWSRVAMKRIGRLRNTVGFGNARAVKNVFDAAVNRHTQRIADMESKHHAKHVRILTRDDILGPKPSKAMLQSCKALLKLEAMEGLREVKQTVKQLLDMVIENSNREDEEKNLLDLSLNKVFLGNPGTGKTTVAKLYAEILTHFGMLSKGEVQMKFASDFIGNVLGSSETQTRAILENARGNVLVIDEAYGLDPSKGLNSSKDIYREAVIDTIVEQVQNVPGEDRAVLLLGYRDKMESMMRNCNPGLKRRFDLENAFEFRDYDDNELVRILKAQVTAADLSFDSPNTAVDVISIVAKNRALPNFGNAGEIQNVLSKAKVKMMTRLSKDRNANRNVLVLSDFEPSESKTTIEELFASLVGCKGVKSKIEQLEANIAMSNRQGLNTRERCPFNFVFTGAPGTGKTTVANLMGKIFHKYGLIGSDEVIMKSPSDFSTGYIGQAGKRTNEIMCSALGKVLFIDEAYGLGNTKHTYNSEVVDEIVKCLTDKKFKGNMVVIMAGYAKEMDQMLDVNEGLRSRFTDKVHFDDFSVDLIKELVLKKIAEPGFEIESSAMDNLDTIAHELKKTPGFANGMSLIMLMMYHLYLLLGRDVVTLADKIFNVVAKKFNFNEKDSPEPVVTCSDLDDALKDLLLMKRSNANNAATNPNADNNDRSSPPLYASEQSNSPPPVSTSTKSALKKKTDAPPVEEIEEHKEDIVVEPYLLALQAILDERGLNTKEGVEKLSQLSPNSREFIELANEIANRLQLSFDEVVAKLKEWQRKQEDIREKVKQAETDTQGMVPIWRCGVCGRADKPYIACYVAPFIVRYEKRSLQK